MLCALVPVSLWAQTPTIQDCLGAIPVCQPVYQELQSPDGTGNYPNEIAQTCNDQEDNSIWYIFTANADGMLGFLITPNDLDDDYDWVLFNLTNARCEDIRNNSGLIVSCNAAGGGSCDGLTGATGATNSNSQGAGCSFGNSPFNALIPMQEGQTFALLVNNWTGSPNGFTINFGLSTGLGIFDEMPPTVSLLNAHPESCGENNIRLTFSEYIECASIHNFDFTLEGPGGPYTLTASSPNCQQSASRTREVRLSINPPIQSMGTFTLHVNPLNNTSLLDLCDNQLLDTSIVFVVDEPLVIEPELGADTSLVCQGDTLWLDASAAGNRFLWDNGDTTALRPVTNGGVYRVTVSDACGTGSDSVRVVVQQTPPVVELGPNQILCPGETITLDASNELSTYLWQDGNTAPARQISGVGGWFRVAATNACGTTLDSMQITYVPPLQLSLDPELVACAGDSIYLNFTSPMAVYQWENGLTTPDRHLIMAGAYRITVTTPCEQWTGATQAIFIVDPQLELGEDRTLCFGDTLLLDANIPGAAYLWQDGSTSATQVVRTPGQYRVRVITACNELNDDIDIEYIAPIGTELGRDTFLCEKDVLFFNANAGVPATYLWDDGSTDPVRRVQGPDVYWVEVASLCQTIRDSLVATLCEQCEVFTPNAFSPNDDGVNDGWRPYSDCVLEDYHLRIYDRWGGLFYDADKVDSDWRGRVEGREAPVGVYVFLLEYTVVEDGYARKVSKRGTLTLVR